MSKKDYVMLTKVISTAQAEGLSLEDFAFRLARQLADDNKAFHFGKFLAACGYKLA